MNCPVSRNYGTKLKTIYYQPLSNYGIFLKTIIILIGCYTKFLLKHFKFSVNLKILKIFLEMSCNGFKVRRKIVFLKFYLNKFFLIILR